MSSVLVSILMQQKKTTYLGSVNVNLGRGGNNVSLVDALKRNTVDLEGTRDEQEARLELLQENNALAAVATGQENKDGTGSDRTAELGSARVFAVLPWGGNILGSVEARGLGDSNDALTTVLGTLDLNGLVGDNSGSGRLDSELALEQDALGNDLRATVLVDTGGHESVAGLKKKAILQTRLIWR